MLTRCERHLSYAGIDARGRCDWCRAETVDRRCARVLAWVDLHVRDFGGAAWDRRREAECELTSARRAASEGLPRCAHERLVKAIRLLRESGAAPRRPRRSPLWRNERCPTHGAFRCADCLGVAVTTTRGGTTRALTVEALAAVGQAAKER